MSKNTYKIYTLGCKVNQYDSAKLGAKLESAGFILGENNVDLAIINTCAVTKTAIRKAKSMINKARIENPKAKIVLIGCWPKTVEKGIKDDRIDLVWAEKDYDELINQISNSQIINRDNIVLTDKSRYTIKIQDGCRQFCSYCIIPYARGELKSRGEQEIITEIKQAVKNGYKEIVPCGIHLGLYGVDLKAKTNLVTLLNKIIKIKGLGRVRLSSIEVREVTDELIDLMKNNSKLCKHLHIPLQSGTDKILKLMNRPYDTNYFRKKIKSIRKAIPDTAISTDVIVGFPGETKKDFEDTYEFVKEMNFSRLHVFPFSAHKKTPAYDMPEQVSKEEKKMRSEKLRKLGERLEKDYKEKFKGKSLEIVVERIKGGKVRGRTEYYFEIEGKPINNEDIKVGEIIKIKA